MPFPGSPTILRTPLAVSLAALFVVNLVPVAGVAWFGWRVSDVLLLFWAENLIIGLMTVFRMGTLLVLRHAWAALFLIPFFVMHYGAFCAGHGLFLLMLFAPEHLQPGPLVETFARILREGDLRWPVLALWLGHVVSFVSNFLGAGEYRRVEVKDLMTLPYRRILILHLVLVGSAMFVMRLGEPMPALLALVVLKIVLDAKAHLTEHRRLQAAPVREAA